MPHIISIGFDPVLLDSRERLLRAAGFKVTSVSPYIPDLSKLARAGADLVIICHTVTGSTLERIEEILASAGLNHIRMDVTKPYHPDAFVDEISRTTGSPGQLAQSH